MAAHRAGADPAAAVTAEPWEQLLGDLWVDVGRQVYDTTHSQLAGDTPKQAAQLVALVQEIVRGRRPAQRIARFIADRAEGITTTSRRRIHTVLREAATPADVREVTRALARLYNTDFVGGRAARVALDNVLRASATFENAAAQQVAVSTGREYVKVWVTQGDDRVRATHAEADGQQVALDEDFKVGGVLLRYPRDPAGPAGETYGCRCWVEHRRL